ncbi:MAG: thioredoxin domain-containing protein [SAR324 cluster bacterium]|nr:thioredoxin domain-containing protein [SAR324 cluster bacterium]
MTKLELTKVRVKKLILTLSLSLLAIPTLFTSGLFGADSLGTINGKAVYIEDIEDREINQLRKKLFEKSYQNFQFAAIERLKKTHKGWGIIKEKQVSDHEANNFYRANKLQKRATFEQLKPQIKLYIIAENKAKQMQAFYDEAVKKKWVTESFTPPADYTTRVPMGSAYTWKGSEKAKVVFLEFSDYQCPFCSRSQATVSALRTEYKGKVLFGYRHYPLPFHSDADEAAVAAECARDQGKFEEMHAILFQNQHGQSPNELLGYGKKIGIKDQGKFESCVKKDQYRGRLNIDMSDAQSIGISGTPAFMIGRYDAKTGTVQGEVLSGALPEAQFKAVIQKYL